MDGDMGSGPSFSAILVDNLAEKLFIATEIALKICKESFNKYGVELLSFLQSSISYFQQVLRTSFEPQKLRKYR